jgi:hypothetical protein
MHADAAALPLDSGCPGSWRREDGQQPLVALHRHKQSTHVSRGVGVVCSASGEAHMRYFWIPSYRDARRGTCCRQHCPNASSHQRHDASLACSCLSGPSMARVMLGNGLAWQSGQPSACALPHVLLCCYKSCCVKSPSGPCMLLCMCCLAADDCCYGTGMQCA